MSHNKLCTCLASDMCVFIIGDNMPTQKPLIWQNLGEFEIFSSQESMASEHDWPGSVKSCNERGNIDGYISGNVCNIILLEIHVHMYQINHNTILYTRIMV